MLDARQNHRRKLQPLGAVQRHQAHRARRPVLSHSALQVSLLPERKCYPQAVEIFVEHLNIAQPRKRGRCAVFAFPALNQLSRLFSVYQRQPFLCLRKPQRKISTVCGQTAQRVRIKHRHVRARRLYLADQVHWAVPQQAQRGFDRRRIARLGQRAEKRQHAAHAVVIQKILSPADDTRDVVMLQTLFDQLELAVGAAQHRDL